MKEYIEVCHLQNIPLLENPWPLVLHQQLAFQFLTYSSTSMNLKNFEKLEIYLPTLEFKTRFNTQIQTQNLGETRIASY